MPSVHPDVSPHIETEGDIKHLADIHAALAEHGATTTGELTQITTAPQVLDSAQFEVPSQTISKPPTINPKKSHDDTSSWGSIFEKRRVERGKLKRAA